MEFKGTPGPWHVNDKRHSGVMNNAIYIAAPNGAHIGRVYSDGGDVEANSKLIAAAPRMLYAGFALLKALQSGKRITFEEESELEAALIQAIGENNG